MNRRQFLTYSGRAAGACIAAACTAADVPQTAEHRRNVLLLLFDDLRYDTFSFRNGPARTPHIDALADESICFSSACTTTGLCSPSRACLFTGRWGHRTGLDDNCHVWHSRLTALDAENTTLIEWARKAGYFVGYFGKWHLGPDGPIRRGAHRYSNTGFERWGHRPTRMPNFDRIDRYYEKDETFTDKPEYYGTRRGTYEQTPTYRKVRDGADFLKEAAERSTPFFLTVSFNAPHPPYIVPEPYNTMYDHREMDLPVTLNESTADKPGYQRDVLWPWHDIGHMSKEDWRKLQAHYYGFVTLVDRAVGEILMALKSLSLQDNTLVVLAGDQGNMLGEHTLYDKGPYCYDELMRVPLLIRVPQTPGRRIKRHVSLLDVNQTLVDWMGLHPDVSNVDSRSLFPLIRRGDTGWDRADEAYYCYEWYNGDWYGIRAIRTHRYKYCWNPAGLDELYDLQEDPREKENLIESSEHRATLRDLQDRLLDHLRTTEDPAGKRMATELAAARNLAAQSSSTERNWPG